MSKRQIREAKQFLAELFEFEYCAECEGDAQHHTVCLTPMGTLFARCDYPMQAETGWEQHPVIKAYRAERDARTSNTSAEVKG